MDIATKERELKTLRFQIDKTENELVQKSAAVSTRLLTGTDSGLLRSRVARALDHSSRSLTSPFPRLVRSSPTAMPLSLVLLPYCTLPSLLNLWTILLVETPCLCFLLSPQQRPCLPSARLPSTSSETRRRDRCSTYVHLLPSPPGPRRDEGGEASSTLTYALFPSLTFRSQLPAVLLPEQQTKLEEQKTSAESALLEEQAEWTTKKDALKAELNEVSYSTRLVPSRSLARSSPSRLSYLVLIPSPLFPFRLSAPHPRTRPTN